MTSDETPDRSIVPNGTKGNKKLKEYCTCTLTTQAGLLLPWAESQVCPVGSLPGQVVVTLILEVLIPGGATLFTKLATFELVATQL